jgi:serine/threonine protein kinase
LRASNILNDTDGTLKLCDYVIDIFAHYMERILLNTNNNGKKHLWFAPEVNFEMSYDTRCDVWGIGCLALELLTGEAPFFQQTNGGDYDTLIRLMKQKVLPDIPEYLTEECTDFLHCCFKYDMKERATIRQLKNHPFIVNATMSQGTSTYSGNRSVGM